MKDAVACRQASLDLHVTRLIVERAEALVLVDGAVPWYNPKSGRDRLFF